MKKILEISVDSVIENLNNEEKKYIIDKLLSYPQAYASSLYITDIFTGEKIYCPIKGYILGDYFWDTEYIYYFEKYNFKLDSNFKKIILSL